MASSSAASATTSVMRPKYPGAAPGGRAAGRGERTRSELAGHHRAPQLEHTPIERETLLERRVFERVEKGALQSTSCRTTRHRAQRGGDRLGVGQVLRELVRWCALGRRREDGS